MAELKRTFTGGKMDKDKDERIISNGDYREALNIKVATSEDSDVGAAQNILGNIKVTEAILGITDTFPNGGEMTGGESGLIGPGQFSHVGCNYHIASIVDVESDKLYRFIHTPNGGGRGMCNFGVWLDRIVEYDTLASVDTQWRHKETAVAVDVFRIETTLREWIDICDDSNRCIIKIDPKHLNFLRWGMRAQVEWQDPGPCNDPMPSDMTVEFVNYTTGEITLDSFWEEVPSCTASRDPWEFRKITFYGDRNLNFNIDQNITGLNIIDGMLFWTDNHSEPKKVNIERSKKGCNTRKIAENPYFAGRTTAGGNAIEGSWIDDFNYHTVLILEDDKIKEDCIKDETFCPPVGCMDLAANNYDILAMVHDPELCEWLGCATLGAVNYGLDCNDNPLPTTGWITQDPSCSCCFNGGCTDPSACNYDTAACFDDGSCIPMGCTDPDAWNYDPTITVGCDCCCNYMWNCIEAGDYTINECGNPINNIELSTLNIQYDNSSPLIPNLSTFYAGLTFVGMPRPPIHQNNVSNTTISASDYFTPTNMQAIEDDLKDALGNVRNIHAHTWPGPQNNAVLDLSKLSNIWASQPLLTPGQNIYDEPIDIMMDWFLQTGANKAANFSEKWFWFHNNNPSSWTPSSTTNTICDYPMEDASGNVIGSMTRKRISHIEISNMFGSDVYSVGGIDGKNFNDWNQTTKAGHFIYNSVQTTPGPGWLPPGALPYIDQNGNSWKKNAWNSPGVRGMFDYTARFGNCGGSPCPDGESWNDIISYLRNNGFNGYGPSSTCGDGAGNSYNCGNQQTGTGGIVSAGNPYGALQGTYFGESKHGYDNQLSSGNVVCTPTAQQPDFGYINNDQANGANYSFSGYPNILNSDGLVEVMMKISNNTMGWWDRGNDGYCPRLTVYVVDCECGNWTDQPTCVGGFSVNDGTWQNQIDCETCTTCPCGNYIPSGGTSGI